MSLTSHPTVFSIITYVLSTGRTYSDKELQRAIELISNLDRLKDAQEVVQRTAPQLQGIFNAVLTSGGWFDSAHEAELKRVAALEDPAERAESVAGLVAEQSQLAMLIGVAVGFELYRTLEGSEDSQ